MIILGIDTSCDDSGAAIVRDGVDVLSNVISSQHNFHKRYGGIVPSIAARRHTVNISLAIQKAFSDAAIEPAEIDAVAVTVDQGLALSLVAGVAAAKTMSAVLKKPLIGMHHLEGHIYSCAMATNGSLQYPYMCLTAAGGHTVILLAHGFGDYELIGGTRDDAAGEVYDKIARRLGLGYPGGPEIDRLAKLGDPARYQFPRPMTGAPGYDLSFSGLKTAVRVTLDRMDEAGEKYEKADIAASFQAAVVDSLTARTLKALRDYHVGSLGVAGGVSANTMLRSRLRQESTELGFDLIFPPLSLCVDNGAMIAGAGYHRYRLSGPTSLDIDIRPNAPVGEREMRYRHASKYR